MLGAEDPYPPVGYSAAWTWLGVAVLGAALVLIAWAWLPRRARAEHPRAITPLARVPLGQLQDRYLGRLADAAAAFRRGDRDERGLHHELSAIVRGFVGDAEGVAADAMTPRDLRRSGLDDAALAVLAYWDPQFREEAESTPAESVAAARQLIQQWGARSTASVERRGDPAGAATASAAEAPA